MTRDTAQDTIEFTPPPGDGPQLTETQRREMAHSAEFQAAARASMTTGRGECDSAPVNFRMSPADVKALAAKVQPPGMKVAAGPIVDTPYSPPIDLDPHVIEGVEGFEVHKGYLVSAQAAFSEAFEGLKKISEGRQQALKNPAWNSWQVLLQVGGFAEKVHAKILKAFDAATSTLTKGIDHIEKELTQPLASGASSAFGKEIREYVRSLPDDKRGDFLSNAIRDNYRPAIESLLGVPPYIAGLHKSVHEHHLRKFREQQNPELVGRQEAMRAALELVEKRASIFYLQSHVEAALGGKFATLKKVRDANSAAEKALAFDQGTNNPLAQ